MTAIGSIGVRKHTPDADSEPGQTAGCRCATDMASRHETHPVTWKEDRKTRLACGRFGSQVVFQDDVLLFQYLQHAFRGGLRRGVRLQGQTRRVVGEAVFANGDD